MRKCQRVFKYWSCLFKYLSECSSGGNTLLVPHPCPLQAGPAPTEPKGQNFPLLIPWRANTCFLTTYGFFPPLFLLKKNEYIYHFIAVIEMCISTCQLPFPGRWGGMSYWYYYRGIDVHVNAIFLGSFWICLTWHIIFLIYKIYIKPVGRALYKNSPLCNPILLTYTYIGHDSLWKDIAVLSLLIWVLRLWYKMFQDLHF